MAEKVQKGDFVELDYTGSLPDGTIFDTTLAAVAKEQKIFSEKTTFAPAVVCIGEKQILSGVDQHLTDKEIGKSFIIKLPPEEAFGKRDVKKIKMLPTSTFKEHNVQPHPGLQIDVDGELGTIMRMAGGRIMVNFNHPLAGKDVQYEVTINRKVTDQEEQIKAFLHTTLRLPQDKIAVSMKENAAEVKIPFALPPQFTDALAKKLSEITKGKEVKIAAEKATPGPVN